jgi:L-seryl-tRNA(Ser) seleniumtransferase
MATIPSWAIAVGPAAGQSLASSANAIDAALRGAPIPVIGRICSDQMLLDVRTIADGEVAEVADALRAAIQ